MKIKDVLSDEHEVFVGQCVRWADRNREYAGMTTGIVMGIEKNAVRLLDVEGIWHTLNPVHLTASLDTRCRDLEAMTPEARADAVVEYIEVWEQRHTTEENEEGEIVPRKGRSSNGGRIGDVIRFIEGSKTRVKKSDIVAGMKITDAEYMHAIRNLLSAKRIKQEGKRRGASYGIPGREYEAVETPKKITSRDVSVFIAYIERSPKPVSRSDLREAIGFTDAEWIEISAALKTSSRIVVTGKKRGTRYSAK